MKYLICLFTVLAFISSAQAGAEVQKKAKALAKQNKQKRGIASEIAVTESNEASYISRIRTLVSESSVGDVPGGDRTFCVGRQEPFVIEFIRGDNTSNITLDGVGTNPDYREETKIRVTSKDGKVIIAACRTSRVRENIPCSVYFLNSEETRLEAYGKVRLTDVMDLSTQTEHRERHNESYCDIDHARVTRERNNR